VAELARGSVADRPWGRTFATLGLRGVTGQLTLVSEGKRFLVAFEYGAVVAASSPLASDAAVRVALTSHLVSSSQVPEISRRQAAAPERDEIDLIAELARLGPDHALRLRRRVIAQRAARTFSINHGEFVVTDRTELEILPGCELDVRAVLYMGARANLPEHRLAAELDQLGSRFRLKPALDGDLPQFGFTDLEQPVVERLRDGGTIDEIEEFATSFVDERTVRAVVYSLAAYNACDVEPPRPGMPSRSAPPITPPLSEHTPTMMRKVVPTPRPGAGPATAQRLPVQARPGTELPRIGAPSPTEPSRGTGPISVVAPRRPATLAPPMAPDSTPVRMPRQTASTPAVPRAKTPPVLAAEGSGTRALARRPTGSPPKLASGSAALTPIDEGLDAPTQREGARGMLARPADAPPTRDGSDPALRRSPGDRLPRDTPSVGQSSAGLRLPSEADAPRDVRDGSSAGLRLPSEVGVPRDARDLSSAGLRLPPDVAVPRDARDLSSAGLRLPSEVAAPRDVRDGSSAGLRLPIDAAPAWGRLDLSRRSIDAPTQRDLRPPVETVPRRDGSDPALPRPLDTPVRRGVSSPGLRPSFDTPVRSDGSSPGLRRPNSSEAEAPPSEPVILRVPSRAAPGSRSLQRSDSLQPHDVKALIAQRLKLLDQGADHFALLGVAQDVAPEALRKAYFDLARQLHPDRLAAFGIPDDGKHAQRLFAQINAGFAILSDPERCADYLHVLRRGGEAAVRAEQARAEELARRIVDAEEAFRRGELALKRDQPQAAIGELAIAIQLHPEEADYHALFAWAQFCAAPDKAAIAAPTRTSLDKAIQRSPRAVAARFYLGRVERMLGRDQEALRHFRDVLDVAPGHAEAAAEVRAIEVRRFRR
jgi:hypothetical protein